jgi:hypothetical protein
VTELPSFRIGSPAREHVVVRPAYRERPDEPAYDDDNWVEATVEVAAGAFSGTFVANLRTDELVRFRDELRPLYESLAGRATFDSTEGWLRVDVWGDGKGHFTAACVANDQPGIGNRLAFKLAFDQTELPSMLRELDAVCEAWPVVERREVP